MINALIIIFSLSLFLSVMTSRLMKYIKMLSLQGFVLFLLIVFSHKDLDLFSYSFLIFETLIVKALAIPYFLKYIIKKNEISREMQANIPAFYSLLISSFIIITCVMLANFTSNKGAHFNHLFLGVSLATIMISLFLIISRKKIITHLMCFLMLENGIFLMSLSMAHEMPFLINLAVLLDVFLVILLLGFLSSHIKTNFEELHIDNLTSIEE